ncbi:hypothetical protein PG993_002225 [Apiospora rasikravindrae]|uniref:Folliculin-interacting protein N-terminal domain-containing protein n=1 Tax=Apiospora rasikravindrae TaxID=990691 RepID=A0ABR1TYA1_9PEZI
MLGKLFNLTSSTSTTNPPPASQPPVSPSPESVQEEIHTRSLLFPDTQALHHRQDQVFPLPAPSALPLSSPSSFDYDGEIGLDVRDVRVVVMQDSLGAVNPALLFDSHPGPAVSDRPATGHGYPQGSVQDRRNPTSPRKTSISYSRPTIIPPESPQARQGAFDRRSSVQSRHYHHVESDTQRASREYREEIANFTSCIFANSEVMSYKGTSTKVHIVPTEIKSEISSSYVGDGKGSMGRSSMRSSKLAQSFTSESAAAAFEAPSPSLRPLERRKVLITRLFPVNLPSDELETPASGPTPLSRHSEDGGFPFPISPDESGPKKKKPQPKQKRTPMYAVALVLHLPPSTPAPGSAPTKPVFKPGSYSENDSFPSSFNSTRRSGWSMAGSGLGAESFDTAYSDGEDGMDAITQHWDIIMRALTHLQSVVATRLFPMLKAVDYSSPEPYHSNVPAPVGRTPSVNAHRRGSNASQMKPPKTNAKLVTLPANCLMQETVLGREVDAARVRIVTGLRPLGSMARRSQVGCQMGGGKEQGFFFFTLLTGFLATHNDWLQALSPVWYRRRYYQQQKGRGEEDTSLPCRTIIVSNDKMVARRLIFLLSAFLPANQQLPSVRAFRPTTSASFSHSPPVVVPILKEEVLRRKLNRKPYNSAPRGPSHGRSFSIQSQATTRSATGIPAQLAHLSLDTQHGRRMSDATFKHTTLPMPGNDLNTRKSSAATTNTITPDAAVPHFSSMHRADTRRSNRPGSSGSTAADDLKRTLRRGGSISEGTAESRRGSNWGNVISTLWNARRKGSTASITQTTLDLPSGRPSPLPSPLMSTPRRDRLAEMAEEAPPSTDESPIRTQPPELDTGHSPKSSTDQPETPKNKTDRSNSSVKRIPDPMGAFESPVKTTINSDDGVIDVDIQFPDYLATLDSAVSSPSSSGYLSTPGLGSAMDSFGQLSRIAVDGDAPLNVAGWLQQYHRDFALQAVAPQADLLDKVRESLMAEPTPPVHFQQLPSEWPTEQWVDVSSAIIADTTNFTIKRLSYKRLIRPKFSPDRSSGTQTHLSSSGGYPFSSSSLMTPALSPYEQPLNEKIEEEVLVTLDETLIEAIERVVALPSDHSSKDSSATSSRSASKRRERRDSELSSDQQQVNAADTTAFPTAPMDVHQEVPRAECKAVVLGTLEGIVQDVVDQREKEGHSPSSRVRYAPQKAKESILRTAIRGWLDTVELGDA